MTLKKSFFSLLREDAKQRLWSIVLAFIVIIIPVSIAAGMTIGADRSRGLTMANNLTRIYTYQNVWLYMVAFVGALICAFCSFSYLFSAKKVDFYHSLPIKRTKYFAIRYLSGILVYLIPNLCMTVLNLLIVLSSGGMTGAVAGKMILGMLFHLTGFLLIYSTACLTIMLVGNTVVFFLVSGWFFSCIAGYVGLYTAMQSSFFETFTSIGEQVFSKRMDALRYLSPAYFYFSYLPNHAKGTLSSGMSLAILEALVLVAILTLLALYLYLKRPSEGTKKAMVFQKSKPVLRISIELITGISLSYVFWGIISDQNRDIGWMILGGLLGVVLCHMLLETIYNYDIKKCFHGLASLIACCVIAVTATLLLRCDAFGFDRYLPKKEKLASVGVYVTSLGFDDLCFEEKDGTYVYRDLNRTDYLNRMSITNSDITYPFLVKLVKVSANFERNHLSDRYYSGYDQDIERITICYTLKNGKKVYREYVVPRSFLLSEFAPVFESPEYKEGFYALENSLPAKYIKGVFVNTEGDEKEITLNKDEMEELLAAVRADLNEQSFIDRCGNNIAMLLEFSYFLPLGNTPVRENRVFSDYYSYSSSNAYHSETIPVYYSFARTLRFLYDHGVEGSSRIDFSRVTHMQAFFDDYRFRVVENGTLLEYSLSTAYDEMERQEVLNWTVREAENASEMGEEYAQAAKTGVPISIVKENWEELYSKCFYSGYEKFLFQEGYRAAEMSVELSTDEYGNLTTVSYYLMPSQDLRFLLETE